jgi:cell division protein FtsL
VNARLRRGGSWLRIALGTALGVALGAGSLVWTRTEILTLRYELANLHTEEKQLRGEVEKLKLEAAALAAPDRIESLARALGLRYPKSGEVIHLSRLGHGGAR